jgi:hypothetical protein
MYNANRPDVIDQEIILELNRPGLIDWTGVQARLLDKKINVERRLLHRRCKELLRSRAREPWLWRE